MMLDGTVSVLHHVPREFWDLTAMMTDNNAMLRRLHELRSEHRDLDTVIERLVDHPLNQLQLQRLKKRKLQLKDEISWIETRLIPDNIA